MKRILSLDGGGIRGVFSLEILLHMEKLLQVHYEDSKYRLTDHFDMFAGTSTGAIIATCLCWGMSVEQVLELYVEQGVTMFSPVPWYKPHKYLFSRYDPRPLSEFLKVTFSEENDGQNLSLLNSKRLEKKLLVVVRNHTTGSAWPLTNNPNALFNDETKPGSNMLVPLWQIVRASTAAPTFFDPEEITIDGTKYVFVDGSVTPYNNPALIAAQTATLPCYRMNWPTGLQNMKVISVGTMRFVGGAAVQAQKLWVGYLARQIPLALIQGVTWQQDFACRCLGQTIFGEPLDSEIGDLVHPECGPIPGTPWFSYVRYNKSYKSKELESILKEHPKLAQLDAVHLIPVLRAIGKAYAEENVKLEHLL